MKSALLIIDVTDFYLNEFKGILQIETIDRFLWDIVRRASQNLNELILLFTDFCSAKFPPEFDKLMGLHGPPWYKDDQTAFDYEPIQESDLHIHLQEHNITKVEVCGLYAHWCVAATVQDALQLGYEVSLNPKLILNEDGKINPDLSSLEQRGAMLI